MLVDAVDCRAVEHVERAHPLRVTLGEVVVDSHHVDAAARERAEKHGECGHESLTLAGGHLGDFALMKHDAADELHAIVHHVPGDFVAAGHPVVFPYGVVAVDGDEIFALCGELAVELSGFDGDCLVGSKAGGCLAHYCKHHGQVVVETLFDGVEHGLLVAVDFVPHGLTLVKGKFLDFETETFVLFLLG